MEVMENPLIEPDVINGIKDKLMAKEETLSVAESVTSGLLQAAVSQAIEASAFYQGGITAYNLGQKYKHLNVDPVHAQKCNCISPEVARQMALHTCELFKSHWGVGITGYAVKEPGINSEVSAYYAIVYNGELMKEGKMISPEESPYASPLFYVREILKELQGLI